jgi:hypothetical protein
LPRRNAQSSRIPRQIGRAFIEKLTRSRLVGRDAVTIMSDAKKAAIGFCPAGLVESVQAIKLPGLIVERSGRVVKARTNRGLFGPPLIPASTGWRESKKDNPTLGKAALAILDECIAVAVQDASSNRSGPPAEDIAGLILLRERVARHLAGPKTGS